MAVIIDEKVKKEITPLLEKLKNRVHLIFFAEKKNCPFCDKQRELIEELASLSDKLELHIYDHSEHADEAQKYLIDKVPATVIAGKQDYGIRFFGLTGGHEFSSLMQAIIMVGTDTSGIHPDLEQMIQEIKKPVHIEVMTTLSCPYCPKAVHAAHQLAMVNEHIRADMVEGEEFPDLARKYDVYGVPKTMINETHSFEGAQPVQAVYLEVLKAVDPQEYGRVKTMIREAQGHRHVRKPEMRSVYDTIIVGGGPAALSAAVYAARKQLNVLLVSKDIGGQIAYTASIDNYLGLPGISGEELKEQFMFHAEAYPIAESLGANVVKVSAGDDLFLVKTNDEKIFKARTVIFCTGKEYRRLGVPGEDRFIGHGIAFCATCDAPLYKNKKVAVVGGGNSAFTAVRDLVGYAKEIHVIHRRDRFTADNSLVQDVKRASNVTFHIGVSVKQFRGDKKLQGIILSSTKNAATTSIDVDGVFLEIGLTPNTDAVRDIIGLNERAEIPVRADNSTDLPGFFAAGDATDVPEKQIIVAAGEGAKAAIAVYKYLVGKKLIEKTQSDDWE
jgi:alkyl hydroperoxide reductase subunit F